MGDIYVQERVRHMYKSAYVYLLGRRLAVRGPNSTRALRAPYRVVCKLVSTLEQDVREALLLPVQDLCWLVRLAGLRDLLLKEAAPFAAAEIFPPARNCDLCWSGCRWVGGSQVQDTLRLHLGYA